LLNEGLLSCMLGDVLRCTVEIDEIRMMSSGMLRRVALVRTDVSAELSASSQRASVASYS
jgi:hypothetical protein